MLFQAMGHVSGRVFYSLFQFHSNFSLSHRTQTVVAPITIKHLYLLITSLKMRRRKTFLPSTSHSTPNSYPNKRAKASKDGRIFCQCGCQKQVSLTTQRLHLNKGGPLRMRRGRSSSSMPASEAFIDLTADTDESDLEMSLSDNEGEPEDDQAEAEADEEGAKEGVEGNEEQHEDDVVDSLWSDLTVNPLLDYSDLEEQIRHRGKPERHLNRCALYSSDKTLQ